MPPTTPPGAETRAAATARTRASIVQAAVVLFSAQGFAAVSLRDVAAAAGVTHPALGRHFASKDELLEAVVRELDGQIAWPLPPLPGSLDDLPAIARGNEAVGAYIALTTGLAGAATRPDHPANARYRRRYRNIRQHIGTLLAAESYAGRIHVAEGEATRLVAAWDGLQVVSLAIPGVVDIPGLLERRVAVLRGSAPGPALDLTWLDSGSDHAGRGTATVAAGNAVEPAGYARGRAQRGRILDGATALFAHAGFYATSIQEIADRVGVGKSTLLHHFPTKAALLAAVLRHRDERTGTPVHTSLASGSPALSAASPGSPAPERDRLAAIVNGARSDAATQPGLIALYTVLSTEATSTTHPAHAYFAGHFRRGIHSFRDSISATYGAEVDAGFEALWFTALWDGLQLQWLFDETVDVGGHLQAHLDELRRRAGAD